MELRHLRYFVAVAEELHVSRAARRLHVAQPAVSEQIRKLERHLGVELLDRTQHRIALTDAGAIFLDEARRVLEQADLALAAARGAQKGALIRLRVGYAPASLPAVVPRALQRLAAAMPTVTTSVHEDRPLALVEALHAGRLDVAIVSLPVPAARLRVTPVGEMPAVAAVPVAHRHAVLDRISLARLAPDRILVLPREAARGFYDGIVATCSEAGLSPTLVEIADGHLERSLLSVAAGAGLAVLPQPLSERYLAPGLRFVPIESDRPATEIAALTLRDAAHLPAAAFVRALSPARTAPSTRARLATARG